MTCLLLRNNDVFITRVQLQYKYVYIVPEIILLFKYKNSEVYAQLHFYKLIIKLKPSGMSPLVQTSGSLVLYHVSCPRFLVHCTGTRV